MEQRGEGSERWGTTPASQYLSRLCFFPFFFFFSFRSGEELSQLESKHGCL